MFYFQVLSVRIDDLEQLSDTTTVDASSIGIVQVKFTCSQIRCCVQSHVFILYNKEKAHSLQKELSKHACLGVLRSLIRKPFQNTDFYPMDRDFANSVAKTKCIAFILGIHLVSYILPFVE